MRPLLCEMLLIALIDVIKVFASAPYDSFSF